MLILASASPRRRELLSQAGLDFTVESAGINEDIQPEESAAKYVQRLAVEKAQAVLALHPEIAGAGGRVAENRVVVLGADTCVLCNGEILGKPQDQADARRMLELLSGRTHQVLTGVAAVSHKTIVSDVEITQVYFDVITEPELVRYLSSAEPLDKAGAYGIQGYAARWIPKIEGCYFNVVGLPLARTIGLLAELNDKEAGIVPAA
jgi:septum formation protein